MIPPLLCRSSLQRQVVHRCRTPPAAASSGGTPRWLALFCYRSSQVMHDLSLHGSHSLVAQLDRRIAERIDGELQFLDGISYPGIFALSKANAPALRSSHHA